MACEFSMYLLLNYSKIKFPTVYTMISIYMGFYIVFISFLVNKKYK